MAALSDKRVKRVSIFIKFCTGFAALLLAAITLYFFSVDTSQENSLRVDQKSTTEIKVRYVAWSLGSPTEASERIESHLIGLNLTETDIRSITDGIESFFAGVGNGDAEQYTSYYERLGGVQSPRAVAVANQQFNTHGLQGFDAQSWATLSDTEKFAAILSNPESRSAGIRKIDPDPVGIGFGWTPPLPKGHRIHGMRSAIDPPSTELLTAGAEAEWLWIHYKVALTDIDDVILQVEFLYDTAVKAWLPQRAAYIADAKHTLPWIVF